ncbi:C2H2-type zinc finger transcription factor [Mucor lusitanicus CBS 277.49]|uniref:C2H2-type zinc finger transcription factor n=2 Tax=Mucor circinelloides f. lusitanicus TaxID=29924 RepID=A0A162R8G1_MUCCL|nr:C2H2-type zinc finger transcription factor [Mucor lusitanicus CBS 277.49]
MKGFHIENQYMSLTSLVEAMYPPNRCTLCDGIFASRIESNQHYREKHKNCKSRYICMHPYCDYRSVTRGALRVHISHAHLLVPSDKPLPDSFQQEELLFSAATTTTTPSPTMSRMSLEPASMPGSPPPQLAPPPVPSLAIMSEPPSIVIKNEYKPAKMLPSSPSSNSSKSCSPPNNLTVSSSSSSNHKKLMMARQSAAYAVKKQPKATFIDNLTPSPPPSPFSMYHPKKDSHSKKAILSKKAETFLNSIYPPLQCPSCKQNFPRKTNVIKHLTDAHVGQEPYRCIYPKCNHPKLYTTREGLIYHIVRVHDVQ